MTYELEIGNEVFTPDNKRGVIVDFMPQTLYPFWVSSLECAFIGIYAESELRRVGDAEN